MSVFFSLPDELCREILVHWLKCEEIGHLDAAVCSKQWRTQLLEFLPYVRGFSNSLYGFKSLQWMNKRGIIVHEVVLDKETSGAEWQLALAPVWKTLKALTVYEDANNSEIISHFNSCIKLEYACFEAIDFKDSVLNGEVFKNLTDLELPAVMSNNDPMPILKLIHKHCRVLKSLDYVFKPTTKTSPLLLDIIRLNRSLYSLSFRVSKNLLQLVTLLCSRRLTNIFLHGRVDFNTMVHVLQKFDNINWVEINTIIDDTTTSAVTYVKKERSLQLVDGAEKLIGWKVFLDNIPRPKEIQWWDFDSSHFDIDDALSSSLQSLYIDCYKIDEEKLKMVLRKYALKKFSFGSAFSVDWPEVMNESNAFEYLNVRGPNDHMIYLLSVCRYLTEVSFSKCTISLDFIPTLIDAIKKYRHETTGRPIDCKCEFRVGDHGTTLHHLSYNGSQFKGCLLKDYEEVGLPSGEVGKNDISVTDTE